MGRGARGAGPAPPFLPEQRLALTDALAAYTSGSAWVNHQDQAGVIAVGRLADLAVLGRDPFAVAPPTCTRSARWGHASAVRVHSSEQGAPPSARGRRRADGLPGPGVRADRHLFSRVPAQQPPQL
ncbi:amidohydrolase family protein [Streptomyces xanthophaeus]|uniref:amidohydrolase family protein n=1 Tax=Streptomyces xanthophaeus TaxID=67385 RepID=UPI003438AD5E